MAVQHQVNTGCSTREAWTFALSHAQSKQNLKETYLGKDICQAMFRVLAWQASSSGVEQNFSKAKRLELTARGQSSENTENLLIRIGLAKLSNQEMNS